MPQIPTDNGATPVAPMSMMDTGRATASVSAIMGRPTPIPMQTTGDPKDFLRDLAAHLENERRKFGGGNDGPPKKTYFGIEAAVMFKVIFAAIIGASTWMFTWYMTVNQGLEARPTVEAMEMAVEKEVFEKVSIHSQQIDPHPGIKEQMIDLKKDTAATRAAVNRMTEVLSGISITGRPRRRARVE